MNVLYYETLNELNKLKEDMEKMKAKNLSLYQANFALAYKVTQAEKEIYNYKNNQMFKCECHFNYVHDYYCPLNLTLYAIQ